ncbi:hypothetical protein ACEPAF_8419 [Sanghuangporus sanghuang]
MSVIASSPEKKPFPVTSPSGNRVERGSTPSTPNQHPYAIKTTSTAVLTRSNSTGYAAPHQHVYIPSTPTSNSKHRHSKSDLSRPSPRPLPIPPSLESPSKARGGHGYTSSEELVFPSVRARADTLPNASGVSLSASPSPVKADDLPSNPRVWTTSQLASYLITALRVKSGEVLPLPLPVAKDIAAFVKEARLNGRSFLRLNEQDLESMGINNLWREALLNASRNLRQNVLKGRIWGFDADDVLEPTRVLPYRNAYNSSTSSIDEEIGSQESTPHKGGDRKGRVRGLVASLERASSSGSGLSNNGSSTSEGDVIPVWVDEEASFASGSEASEVEERKARAVTKKRIFPEPPALLTNASQKAQIAPCSVSSPEEEPSVEDLLVSGSMSGSWGAKAWEDMNIGETVKHIGVEHGANNGNSHDDVFGQVEVASRSGSGKHSDSRKGNARKQVKDIFARTLPLRPLPSPPKSESCSPLLPTPPVRIPAKADRSVQVDSGSPDSGGIRDRAQDADVTSTEDSEKLRQALSLLEQYKKQLSELEEKITLLERENAEQARIEHCSQAIETDALSTLSSARAPAGSHLTELRLSLPDHVETASHESPTSRSGLPVDCGVDSARSSLHSSISAEDSDESASPRSNAGPTWHGRRFDNHEWDPVENGIASYVLMVGVGVCAVVLSTILKRLAGKKS